MYIPVDLLHYRLPTSLGFGGKIIISYPLPEIGVRVQCLYCQHRRTDAGYRVQFWTVMFSLVANNGQSNIGRLQMQM